MILHHMRTNAVAYLALVVALGTGTAYAADQVADGSVTSKKLAKNAVTSPKVKKGAIRSSDLKDGSVTGTDVQDGSLTGAEVKDGSLAAADLAAGVLPQGLVFSGQTEGGSPAVTPDSPNNRSHPFVTGGQAYVQFTYNEVGVLCTAGSARMGLYVDGVPVPGTSYRVPLAADAGPLGLGAVVTTTPGTHTASIGLDCPSGTPQSSTHTDSRWFVLATKG